MPLRQWKKVQVLLRFKSLSGFRPQGGASWGSKLAPLLVLTCIGQKHVFSTSWFASTNLISFKLSSSPHAVEYRPVRVAQVPVNRAAQKNGVGGVLVDSWR